MMIRHATWFCVLLVLGSALNSHADIIRQAPGSDHIVIEAELFEIDDLNDEFTGFTILDTANPDEYELEGGVGFIELPQSWSDPSGGKAIMDQAGGGDFRDQITYQVEFADAGTYYLYFRYSLFDMRGLIDNTYGNEDSFYIPFNSFEEDPAGDSPEIRDDRVGFSALSSNIDGNAVLPENSCRDIEAEPLDDEPVYFTPEECDAEGFRAERHWEGQYHWAPARFNFTGENASYEIDETGSVLDYTIASRERGSSLDVLVFSKNPDLTSEELDVLAGIGDITPGVAGDFNNDGTRDVGDLDLLAVAMIEGDVSFDLTGDGAVDMDDRIFWVQDLSNTYIGDANLDGEFSSADFVTVFGAAKYETDAPATWSEGDWNGDGAFTSGDFVAAFSGGGYENGPRDGGLQVVPEPSSCLLVVLGILSVVCCFRQK